MIRNVEFLDEAIRDMQRLDHSAQIQVFKGIRKVAQNPVSIHEGGYVKPLGHHNGNDLSGLFKIKFRDLGLRVVYKAEMVDSRMKIIGCPPVLTTRCIGKPPDGEPSTTCNPPSAAKLILNSS